MLNATGNCVAGVDCGHLSAWADHMIFFAVKAHHLVLNQPVVVCVFVNAVLHKKVVKVGVGGLGTYRDCDCAGWTRAVAYTIPESKSARTGPVNGAAAAGSDPERLDVQRDLALENSGRQLAGRFRQLISAVRTLAGTSTVLGLVQFVALM